MRRDINRLLMRGVSNRRHFIFAFLLLLLLPSHGRTEEAADAIMAEIAERLDSSQPGDLGDEKGDKDIQEIKVGDDTEKENRNWWYLAKRGELSMQDTTVVWPKFLKFCVGVYNWGDRTFNTYDPEYVEGSGKKWKARLVNDNWSDSYSMHIRNEKLNLRMLSDLYCNLGAYLQFMAVSVGYSVDLNTIAGGKPTDHMRFDTNFNCALFNFDLNYTKNSGGTYIRKLNGYNNNRYFKSYFPGVDMSTLGVSLYYFLNNKRYSQGAAYNFSRYQKKSAGSWMFGLSYSNLDINMDFTTLDPKLLPYLNISTYFLKFHYHSYCALFGYGYNWVLPNNWLINFTAMPSVGVNQCFEDATDGSSTLFALNVHGRFSVTYNHRALFLGLVGKITGNWYTSGKYSLFNAVEYFSANLGVRF